MPEPEQMELDHLPAISALDLGNALRRSSLHGCKKRADANNHVSILPRLLQVLDFQL